jgi:hypothetical protein
MTYESKRVDWCWDWVEVPVLYTVVLSVDDTVQAQSQISLSETHSCLKPFG